MLIKRIFTGLFLAVLLIGAVLYFPRPIVALIIALLIGSGLWEFYSIVENKGFKPLKICGIVCGVALSVAAYAVACSPYIFLTDKMINFILLIVVLFSLVKYAFKKDGTSVIVNSAVTIAGILYVSFLFTFIIKIRFLPDVEAGRWLVLAMFIITKMSDIFAYFVGIKLGKHKLIPRISAGKSIEGSVAGVAGSVITSILLRNTLLGGMGLGYAIILGVLLSVAGQIGDLIESLIKRDGNVKDSGTFVPGLGGILDFMDSLLFAGPVMYFFLIYLNPELLQII